MEKRILSIEKWADVREIFCEIKTFDKCDWNASNGFILGTPFAKKASKIVFQVCTASGNTFLVEEVKNREMTNALSDGYLSGYRQAIIEKLPIVTVNFSSTSACYAGSRYDFLPAIAASSLGMTFLAGDHDEIVNGIMQGAKVWYLMDVGDEQQYGFQGQGWIIAKARYVIECIEDLKKHV